MNESIGFVLGNRQRERVVQVLGSRGALSVERIGKVERMTPIVVKRILQELAEKDLVKEAADGWALTELGGQVEKEIKRRA
jgi:predicted transcriptional regulator